MCRGKVFSSVVVVVKLLLLFLLLSTKIARSQGVGPEKLVNTTNLSNLVKNWHQYTLNRVAQPTSITNGVFLLTIIAIPIDHVNYALSICNFIDLIPCIVYMWTLGLGRPFMM